MRRFTAWDAVALLAIAAAVVASWTVFDRLPDPMPTHFGLDGKANGWMPRAYGAFLVPAIAFVAWLFTRLMPLVLPRKEKARLSNGSVPLVAMMSAVFLAAVHVVVLYVDLQPRVDILRLVFLLMALFFIGLGLIMPRLRRNPIIGIRTPWTLTSDENWARTHRVAGYSMVAGGVFGGLMAMIGGVAGSAGALVCFLASAIVPAVWSFLYARRQDPG